MRIGASSTCLTLVDARAAGVGVATDPMRSVRNPAVSFVLSASVTRPRRCAGARASRTIAESVPFGERSYKMSRNDDLVSDVTDELYWDPKVDNSPIAPSPAAATITLRGTVASLPEKRAPDSEVIHDGIQHAFKLNAKIDADDLHVWTSAGTVTIEGPVSSWAEPDEALAAAWAAPGVIAVDDRMPVEY